MPDGHHGHHPQKGGGLDFAPRHLLLYKKLIAGSTLGAPGVFQKSAPATVFASAGAPQARARTGAGSERESSLEPFTDIP